MLTFHSLLPLTYQWSSKTEITCSSQQIFPSGFLLLCFLVFLCSPAGIVSIASSQTLLSRFGLNVSFSTELSSVTFSTPSIPAKYGNDFSISYCFICVILYCQLLSFRLMVMTVHTSVFFSYFSNSSFCILHFIIILLNLHSP